VKNTSHILQHYGLAERDFAKEILALKRDVLQNHRVKVTNFLTLREQDIVRDISGGDVVLSFDGGFDESERKVVRISADDLVSSGTQVQMLRLTYNHRFGRLRHQDVLGALLGLGLERKVVGDIVVAEGEAFVALRANIAQYVEDELVQVGRLAVKTEKYNKTIVKKEEKFKEKTIYVNSLRLDSLVSHILTCNREQAKSLITKELVQINGRATTNYKARYAASDIISIRKFGRIYIDDIVKTRRERFKVEMRIT